MQARWQRGSALLLTMIVVLVVTVIAVAMIRFSSRELAGATAARQNDALVACAEAGRQVFMSQFRALGISPTSLQPLNVALDGTGGATRAVGGHVDSNVQVDQVTVLPASTFGPQPNTVRDCQDHGTASDPTSGRQLEVEFGLRFGI